MNTFAVRNTFLLFQCPFCPAFWWHDKRDKIKLPVLKIFLREIQLTIVLMNMYIFLHFSFVAFNYHRCQLAALHWLFISPFLFSVRWHACAVYYNYTMYIFLDYLCGNFCGEFQYLHIACSQLDRIALRENENVRNKEREREGKHRSRPMYLASQLLYSRNLPAKNILESKKPKHSHDEWERGSYLRRQQ